VILTVTKLQIFAIVTDNPFMNTKSLPAHLQQVLEQHVAQSQLTDNDELQDIFAKLNSLNSKVELLKLKIIQNRQNKLSSVQK
jgi:hypothetical protein